MTAADDALIDHILTVEGGAVAPPDRSGRISRWGITALMLSDYRGHAVTDDEIRLLSATEARDIYEQDFIHKPSLHLISDDLLRSVLVDFAVNSGPERAVRTLQHCLGVPEDGIVGAQTLHAANVASPGTLAGLVCWERVRHLGHLITADPSQAVNAAGWFNRVADLGQSAARA